VTGLYPVWKAAQTRRGGPSRRLVLLRAAPVRGRAPRDPSV